MQSATCPDQDKAFFDLLNQQTDLDQRDNRGKKHSLAFVLVGVVMALLAGRDGNLSAIQRHMKNQYQALSLTLAIQATGVISRAHLPRLLAQVNYTLLAQLIQHHYGFSLPEGFANWLSGDGKELRGSIARGQQRGEVCVSIVTHTQAIVAQAYHNGAKESERPAIANLLKDNDLLNKKIVLDALHLVPSLLEAIHQAGGTYLIGLKANQERLERFCLFQTLPHKPAFEWVDEPERGHGRIDQRTYRCYALAVGSLDKRWAKAGLTTLVVVTRVRKTLKGVETARAVSYFVTNRAMNSQLEADSFYDAVRGHWSVEVLHYRRDVVLAEDACRSKSSSLQRTLSSLRTLTMSLLQWLNPPNMAAQLQQFAERAQELIDFLRLKRVL